MKRLLILIAALAIVAAACGSSDDSADTTTTAPPATTTTAAPTTTVAPTTTTEPATTTTTKAEIPTEPVVPGENEDVDAIVETYDIVFDSTTTFEEKEPYVTDLTGLEDTVAAYQKAGEGMGGITLDVTEVGIDGADAHVIYSFLFAGSPAYEDLDGEAVLTDDGWQVTREFFCSIMGSARVGCSS